MHLVQIILCLMLCACAELSHACRYVMQPWTNMVYNQFQAYYGLSFTLQHINRCEVIVMHKSVDVTFGQYFYQENGNFKMLKILKTNYNVSLFVLIVQKCIQTQFEGLYGEMVSYHCHQEQT